MSMPTGDWLPIPGTDLLKQKSFKRALRKWHGRTKIHRDFTVATKVQLQTCSKAELVDMVRTLQIVIHDCAAELGITCASRSSDYSFNSDFVNRVITIISGMDWYE